MIVSLLVLPVVNDMINVTAFLASNIFGRAPCRSSASPIKSLSHSASICVRELCDSVFCGCILMVAKGDCMCS